MEPKPEQDLSVNLLQFKPPKLGDLNGRIVAESNTFVVFFLPGRTVYRGSDEGSQYQNAEYVLLEKRGRKLPNNTMWVRELLRFRR